MICYAVEYLSESLKFLNKPVPTAQIDTWSSGFGIEPNFNIEYGDINHCLIYNIYVGF
jgi:hypothetical protein